MKEHKIKEYQNIFKQLNQSIRTEQTTTTKNQSIKKESHLKNQPEDNTLILKQTIELLQKKNKYLEETNLAVAK